MKISRFFETWDGTARVNRWQLFINVVLAVSLAALTVKSLTDHERVVLVPPHLSERAEVSWNKANAEYYEGFGMYIATMIGNITPRTAEFISDQLAFLVSPDIYQSMRTQILAIASDPMFQKNDQFNYFSPETVVYEPQTKKIYITGILTTSAFAKTIQNLAKVAESKDIVYEVKMDILNGRPIVTGFDSYWGNTAHTELWKSKNIDKVIKFQKEKDELAKQVVIQPPIKNYDASSGISEQAANPNPKTEASAAHAVAVSSEASASN